MNTLGWIVLSMMACIQKADEVSAKVLARLEQGIQALELIGRTEDARKLRLIADEVPQKLPHPEADQTQGGPPEDVLLEKLRASAGSLAIGRFEDPGMLFDIAVSANIPSAPAPAVSRLFPQLEFSFTRELAGRLRAVLQGNVHVVVSRSPQDKDSPAAIDHDVCDETWRGAWPGGHPGAVGGQKRYPPRLRRRPRTVSSRLHGHSRNPEHGDGPIPDQLVRPAMLGPLSGPSPLALSRCNSENATRRVLSRIRRREIPGGSVTDGELPAADSLAA
ncbi:MAG: hypothetical protein AB1486_01540 [Planctomycetota bacterium]